MYIINFIIAFVLINSIIAPHKSKEKLYLFQPELKIETAKLKVLYRGWSVELLKIV